MNGRGSGGYGKPPASGKYRKGQSGNPAGRPKGRHRQPPHEEIFGQVLPVTERGARREMPASDAFQLRLLDLALKGNSAARRAVEELKAEQVLADDTDALTHLARIVHLVTPGSVNTALELLRMGKILDRFDESRAKVALEPWLIEAALSRLGARRLSREEQEKVVSATRTPRKVRWPDWWVIIPD